jgi:hypothetical protein
MFVLPSNASFAFNRLENRTMKQFISVTSGGRRPRQDMIFFISYMKTGAKFSLFQQLTLIAFIYFSRIFLKITPPKKGRKIRPISSVYRRAEKIIDFIVANHCLNIVLQQ